MFSIHHIHTIRAVPSQFDESNYITLEFSTTTKGEKDCSVVLYFEGPLVPGELRYLCDAINSGAEYLDRPKPEPDINADIPF